MIFFYTNPILIAAAVIPAIFLLVKVYRADKLEKEPPLLLFSLIVYGIIATGLAMATERLGTALLNSALPQDSLMYNVLMYFAVVAISEEGAKYLLLKIRTWRSPSFNCQFDGVVYATFVSLGFALWENIGYVIRYGFGTAMIRAVTAVPGHACFGVFMGVWYGIAKKHEGNGHRIKSRICRMLSLVFPILMHGAYDFIATYEYIHYAWAFVAFVAVMFAVALILVRHMSSHDKYINNYNSFWR
jgi:RsiW-degrading membrane proteinase PrsW (M82 family)